MDGAWSVMLHTVKVAVETIFSKILTIRVLNCSPLRYGLAEHVPVSIMGSKPGIFAAAEVPQVPGKTSLPVCRTEELEVALIGYFCSNCVPSELGKFAAAN